VEVSSKSLSKSIILYSCLVKIDTLKMGYYLSHSVLHLISSLSENTCAQAKVSSKSLSKSINLCPWLICSSGGYLLSCASFDILT